MPDGRFPPSPGDLDGELAIAVEAAQRAGALLVGGRPRSWPTAALGDSGRLLCSVELARWAAMAERGVRRGVPDASGSLVEEVGGQATGGEASATAGAAVVVGTSAVHGDDPRAEVAVPLPADREVVAGEIATAGASDEGRRRSSWIAVDEPSDVVRAGRAAAREPVADNVAAAAEGARVLVEARPTRLELSARRDIDRQPKPTDHRQSRRDDGSGDSRAVGRDVDRVGWTTDQARVETVRERLPAGEIKELVG